MASMLDIAPASVSPTTRLSPKTTCNHRTGAHHLLTPIAISLTRYLLGAGKPYYPLALVALIMPQVFFQFNYFLKDPVKYDVKYQASAQPFLILGLLVTALATRPLI